MGIISILIFDVIFDVRLNDYIYVPCTTPIEHLKAGISDNVRDAVL